MKFYAKSKDNRRYKPRVAVYDILKDVKSRENVKWGSTRNCLSESVVVRATRTFASTISVNCCVDWDLKNALEEVTTFFASKELRSGSICSAREIMRNLIK